jgi:hypothetical protein
MFGIGEGINVFPPDKMQGLHVPAKGKKKMGREESAEGKEVALLSLRKFCGPLIVAFPLFLSPVHSHSPLLLLFIYTYI